MVFSCFPFRMSINVTMSLPLPVASMFGSCGFQVMSKLMPGVWILYAPLVRSDVPGPSQAQGESFHYIIDAACLQPGCKTDCFRLMGFFV